MKKLFIVGPILLVIILLIVFALRLNYKESFKCNIHKKQNSELIVSNPEAQGMDSLTLVKLNNHILNKHPYIKSLLILRNGYIIFEKYYQDNNANTLFQMTSATKLITALIIGIAIQEENIEGITQNIADYFPELVTSQNKEYFKSLKIENLLTMTDGIVWNEGVDAYKLSVRLNYIKHAFKSGQKGVPGNKFNYSSLSSQLLSGIITKTTKMNEAEYAMKHLFCPLGITDGKWGSDFQGNTLGGFNLNLRARDMAKIGQLCLNRGIWEGNQIVDSSWIDDMTTKKIDVEKTWIGNYGYHCWLIKIDKYNAYLGAGFGGQCILVISELNIVLVHTANPDKPRYPTKKIVSSFIIPAVIQ
jgi:CubicO group peptidase (beta-lactamase class C family)